MNKRKEIVPNNLKEYRLKAELTQKEVAEMLRLDCENRISRWEQGLAMPNARNLFKLCKLYNSDITEIFS